MNRQHIGVLFGGILLLVVAMGISRFAFTPILPFMRIDEGISFEAAGYLASSNYIGYFVGALGAGFIFRNKKNFLLIKCCAKCTVDYYDGVNTFFLVMDYFTLCCRCNSRLYFRFNF